EFDNLGAQAKDKDKGLLDIIVGAVVGFLAKLSAGVRKWLISTFGKFIGTFLATLLEGLVVIVVLSALGPVGTAIGLGLLGYSVVKNAERRAADFLEDNGREPTFWETLGLAGLAVADVTGVPHIVEGMAGQRAFGRKLSVDECDE